MKYVTVFFANILMTLSLQATAGLAQKADEMQKHWDSQDHYSNTEVFYAESPPKYKKQIPLTLVVLEGSGWTENLVAEKLGRTIDIFEQCKVSLYPVFLIKTKSANGHVVDWEYPSSVLAKANLENKAYFKPIVYFVSRELHNRGGGGTSWVAADEDGKGNLEYYSSLMYYSNASPRTKNTSLSDTKTGYYEALAHELTHLFTNQGGHNGTGLLLSPIKIRTNILSNKQCQRIIDFTFNGISI